MNANERESSVNIGAEDAQAAAHEPVSSESISSESISSVSEPSCSFADNRDWVSWAAGELDGAGVENARFEAQLLLALALGLAGASVIAQTFPEPTEAQRERFAWLVRQRMHRVPLAYLRGTQEFYGLEFFVTPDTLIPRPETELLVDKVGEIVAELLKAQETVTLADVGTGSGCIPIALVHTYAGVLAVAFDISAQALDMARQNALHNGVAERIRFVRSDLLAAAGGTQFDLIVSNPPYIASGDLEELQAEVREWEPHLALDGGNDGLVLYRRLVVEAWQALKPGGWLLVEVGRRQASEVVELMQAAGCGDTQTYLDFASIERVVSGRKLYQQ